jgi:hypothetical protein
VPAAPFSEKFKKKGDGAPKPGISVADALKVLEGATKGPRQQALIKRLQNEFDGSASTQRPATSSDSPGMKAARGAMSPAVLKHAAKGDESQPQGQGSESQR